MLIQTFTIKRGVYGIDMHHILAGGHRLLPLHDLPRAPGPDRQQRHEAGPRRLHAVSRGPRGPRVRVHHATARVGDELHRVQGDHSVQGEQQPRSGLPVVPQRHEAGRADGVQSGDQKLVS